ncbi:MAG: hypothetical protein IT546_04115 [Caulobacteraceae bacterium]|nr:hypothetical protein [Caulobacteraceae bacterium]
MRAIASIASIALLLMAQPAAARQSEGPPDLPLERKAGCGVALVALDRGVTRFPGALGMVKPDQRGMMRFMMQALGAQGQTMLDDAFAEGAARGLTPGQVYAAGVDDMLAAFEGISPRGRDAGERVMKRFFERCQVAPPQGA